MRGNRARGIAGTAAGAVVLGFALYGIASAGGGSPYFNQTFVSNYQQTTSTNGPVQTNSSQFNRIDGALEDDEADSFFWDDTVAISVMVVMKKGKAAFRVVDGAEGAADPGDGDVTYPSSYRVAGKGAHSLQFILADDQGYIFPPELQWKRLGRGAAVAQTIVGSAQGEFD